MQKVNRTELINKLTYWTQELGLTTEEIAERINTDYNATDETKYTRADVAKLKAALGLKGLKPKKKALFEIIEDEAPVVIVLEESQSNSPGIIGITQETHTEEVNKFNY
jgi:hypothetical protein